MSSDIIKKLEELQEDSNKRLNIKVKSKIQSHDSPMSLVRQQVMNNKLVYTPI
ncbi:hypothetical protein MNBD_GAMMA11-2166 [hydrothermal vent metagenome]|uniref:Uncharacterized protein n=1 Tax=hydrothermal vent metagenome TaxID=652676 RepID=A0A3B0X553_9ZZZZ